MYLTRPTRKSKNGKAYETVLLRESYREDGRVKNRTLANLTHCKPEEIAAIELALRYKNDLSALVSLHDSVELCTGVSVGAVWTVYRLAQRLGIEKALGADFEGRLALWQVIARVLEQGSRLSAVRLAQMHAVGGVLNLSRGFDEDRLYKNLHWLCENQSTIEQKLFRHRPRSSQPELFLYDVTSSYLEGTCNALGAYGYNRDGKKGKPQIVVGLLCDAVGEPISTEVFSGNTQDTKTVYAQIEKARQRFGCERVTFVGDRGMIKSGSIESLSAAGFHYITAITKSQIKTLLKQGLIQLELFDEDVCEVSQDGVRYVLRRNPRRVEEIAASREAKRKSVERTVQHENTYLSEHPRADAQKAVERVRDKLRRLRIDAWLGVDRDDRTLRLEIDEDALAERSRLDGCYVLRTDLPSEVADTQTVHDRYKDLAQVEWAFRTCKTAHLEIRPVYVRTEESTRGHVLVVMLAYMIVRALRRAWAALDLTVEEGIRELETLCSTEIHIQGQASCQQIPKPRESSKALLEALDIHMPEALPHRKVEVVTRKKLPTRRKTH